MPKLMGLWSIQKLKINNIKVYHEPYGVAPVFIAVSRESKRKKIWQVLLNEIARMIDSGEYQKITYSYISEKPVIQ
jgi:hypothetical protein